MIATQTIPEQLTEIYLTKEHWHAFKMLYEEALQYHIKRYNSGDIQVYQENGEVLGYYEREILWNVCFLKNAFIKEPYRKGKVFRELYNRFFETLPSSVKYIVGEKQRFGGKWMKAKVKYASSLSKSKERNSLALNLV